MIVCKYEKFDYEMGVTNFIEENSNKYKTFKVISIIESAVFNELMFTVFYIIDKSELKKYEIDYDF